MALAKTDHSLNTTSELISINVVEKDTALTFAPIFKDGPPGDQTIELFGENKS